MIKRALSLSILGCASMFLGGCCSKVACDPQMLAVLQSIDKKLGAIEQKLEKQPQPISVSSNFVSRGADLKALEKIKPLPEKPSNGDILRYLQDIQEASRTQNSFSPSDPQVAMIRKIGPGHLELIASLLSGGHYPGQYHLHYALPDLVRSQDKELVLKLLPHTPALYKAVIRNGWVEDARETLFELLRRSTGGYELYSNAGILVKTDADRERLIVIFQANPNASYLYDTIRMFPGANLAEITEKAWRNLRYQGYEHSKIKFAQYAAENGCVDALGEFIQRCTNPNTNMYGQFTGTLYRLTGVTGDPVKLCDWFDKNKNNLVFDKQTQSFKVAPKN